MNNIKCKMKVENNSKMDKNINRLTLKLHPKLKGLNLQTKYFNLRPYNSLEFKKIDIGIIEESFISIFVSNKNEKLYNLQEGESIYIDGVFQIEEFKHLDAYLNRDICFISNDVGLAPFLRFIKKESGCFLYDIKNSKHILRRDHYFIYGTKDYCMKIKEELMIKYKLNNIDFTIKFIEN